MAPSTPPANGRQRGMGRHLQPVAAAVGPIRDAEQTCEWRYVVWAAQWLDTESVCSGHTDAIGRAAVPRRCGRRPCSLMWQQAKALPTAAMIQSNCSGMQMAVMDLYPGQDLPICTNAQALGGGAAAGRGQRAHGWWHRGRQAAGVPRAFPASRAASSPFAPTAESSFHARAGGLAGRFCRRRVWGAVQCRVSAAGSCQRGAAAACERRERASTTKARWPAPYTCESSLVQRTARLWCMGGSPATHGRCWWCRRRRAGCGDRCLSPRALVPANQTPICLQSKCHADAIRGVSTGMRQSSPSGGDRGASPGEGGAPLQGTLPAPVKGACRVPGCAQRLLQPYNQRHRICRVHQKVAAIEFEGLQWRFCQQVGAGRRAARI